MITIEIYERVKTKGQTGIAVVHYGYKARKNTGKPKDYSAIYKSREEAIKAALERYPDAEIVE